MIDVTFDFTSDSYNYWDGFWDRNDGLAMEVQIQTTLALHYRNTIDFYEVSNFLMGRRWN